MSKTTAKSETWWILSNCVSNGEDIFLYFQLHFPKTLQPFAIWISDMLQLSHESSWAKWCRWTEAGRALPRERMEVGHSYSVLQDVLQTHHIFFITPAWGIKTRLSVTVTSVFTVWGTELFHWILSCTKSTASQVFLDMNLTNIRLNDYQVWYQ